MESPAGPKSGQPHLYVGAGGTLWMSWVEPVDSARHALRYASFDGEAWSAVRTAAAGTDWFVNWADVPSLRPLPDGGMAAHYLKSSGASVYAYDVRIAQTDEGGAWQEAITPHDDGTPTEHGFVSLLPWEGDLLAVWLDGRNMLTAEGEEGGPMTLRAGLITPSGAVTRPALLDDRTCECCNTAAVRTEAGVLVAYRDRTPEEVRDIYLTRFDGQTWTAPSALARRRLENQRLSRQRPRAGGPGAPRGGGLVHRGRGRASRQRRLLGRQRAAVPRADLRR